jgi:hypothetical protein
MTRHEQRRDEQNQREGDTAEGDRRIRIRQGAVD